MNIKKKDPRRKILKQIIAPRNGMPWKENRDWLPDVNQFKDGVIVSTFLRPVKEWKKILKSRSYF
jgi:hypothetical protein